MIPPLSQHPLARPQAIQPIWLKPIVLNVPTPPPVAQAMPQADARKPLQTPLPSLIKREPFLQPTSAFPAPYVPSGMPTKNLLSQKQQVPFQPLLQPQKVSKTEPETEQAEAFPESGAGVEEEVPLPFLAPKSPPAPARALESITKALGQLTQLETLRSKTGGLQNAGWTDEKLLKAGLIGLGVTTLPVLLLSQMAKRIVKQIMDNVLKPGDDFFTKWQKQQEELSGMGDKMIDPSKLDVKLEDVQGIEGAKAEILDIIRYLQHYGKHNYTRAKMPKGVLLQGPPGNGKTMLAKAIAAESGVPFFSVSGSDFMEKYVGVGAARVRKLFEAARKHKPCVIFIDEMDTVGKQRTSVASDGAGSEHQGTLNQLLKELDGMSSEEGVLVLAATNRADVLDKALTRPGRFDKTLNVKAPWTDEQRLAILKSHIAKHYPDVMGSDIDLAYIAEITDSCSGAELANIVNEAARLANRRILNALEKGQALSAKEQKITQLDFIDAFENVLGGVTEPKDLYPARFTQSIVVHEGLGHAWLAYLMDHPIYMISTQPRSGSYGHVHHGRRRGADKLMKDRQYYLEGLLSLMAGTTAEEVLYSKKNVSNGATSDLEKANKMLRSMMSEFGHFNQELGFLVNLRDPNTGKDVYTENEKQKMEALTRKILDNAYHRVRWVIEQIPADDKQRFMHALTEQRVVKGPQANLALFESNIHALQNPAFLKQLRAVLDEFIEDPTKEFRPPQGMVA